MFKILTLLVFISSPAFAGTAQLEAQIAELRRVNETQATNLASALNRVQEMVGEFQKMHGQVDASLHANEEQDKILKDSQLRLEAAENKLQLLVTQLEELKIAGLLPPDAVKNLSQFRSFEKALSRVNAGDFKQAIVDLKSFLTANAKSPFAEHAQYWIGESYFAMRDFTAAVAEFQSVIKKYPQSSKVPPSLLKQGLSFFEMQSFEEAKAFLTKVATRFPQSREAIRAQDKI
ncbi:MAG: tol-pal system protein YbgF, partial [Deltaproteobacteria bacterium]|nr:tol-pal system protein YbgF [Deltaproteobacteria bacterium]